MQVTVENTGTLERRIKVALPAEQIVNKCLERMKELTRTVKVDGFRPGKVPLTIIQQRFGDSVEGEVLNDLIQKSFYDAIMQEALEPAGLPNFEPKKFEKDKPFEYIATFEVFPEITLASVDGVEIEKQVAEISETDLENTITQIREQRATTKEVDRAAQEKDSVNIDFEGRINGELFEGGSANGVNLVLGAKQFLPEFEQSLTNAKKGDECKVELTFPENYGDLGGKDAVFTIKVNSVSEQVLPELDDEFIKQMQVEGGTVEAFRELVKENMQKGLDTLVKRSFKSTVFDKLVELNDFDLPKPLIDQEIIRLQKETLEKLKAKISAGDLSQLSVDHFEEQARKNVRLNLLIREYLNQEKLTVDPERVRSAVEDIAAAYQKPSDITAAIYADEKQLNEVKGIVLEEQIVEHITSKMKIVEVSQSYDDIMKKGQ